MPCLFGALTSFFVPLPVTVAISLIWPDEFDWSVFIENIKRVRSEHGVAVTDEEEKAMYFTPERVKYMKRMSRWAAFWSIFTIIGHVLLWPLPMYGAKMTFSKSVSTYRLIPCPTITKHKTAVLRLDRDFAHLAVVHTYCWVPISTLRRRRPANLDCHSWQERRQGNDGAVARLR